MADTVRQTHDVLILGQGAAAFSAALYAARYQVRTVMIGAEFGGETAIGGVIENYPGIPQIDGFDLMLKFKEQVDALGVPLIQENVSEMRRTDGAWQVLAGDQWYEGAAVVVAVGRRRRTLGLSDEKRLMGKGVSYCSTCDAPLYRGKRVVVVGGGDSAVKGALLIAKYATQVHLSYRGSRFTRPEPIAVQRLHEAPNIQILFNTVVAELKGEDHLEQVVLALQDDGLQHIEADGIFIEIGADPNSEFARAAGVKTNQQSEIIVDKGMRTNIPGIFAAGDVSDSSGELKQTITAAAQGAIAATSAYEYIIRQPRAIPASKPR